MKILVSFLVLFALGCSSAGTKTPESNTAPKNYTSAAQMPVEEFFKNPVIAGYKVSPDGKMLAVLKSWKNRLNIFVHPIDDVSKIKQITFVEDRDIRRVFWKGSDYVLYPRDTGGDENTHVYAVNVKTAKVTDLTPYEKTRADIVDDLEESSPTDILIQHNQRNKEVFDLYRVNVTTGESKMIAQNDNQILSWLIDHTGTPRGGVASDGVNSVVYFESTKGKPWTVLFKSNFRTSFEPFAFTADNKNLYVSSNVGTDLVRIIEIDPNKKPENWTVKTHYTNKRYDPSTAHYSIARKSLGLVEVVTDRREFVWLNPADQKDWDEVKKAIGGDTAIWLSNASTDERILVIRTILDTSRGGYYVFNRDTRKLTHLGDIAPWLKPELMSPMKTVNYRSRDGLDIQGYLTIPRGSSGKDLPVVINPHGGPWARDEWGFDPEVQLLASRGYAVFQMNFRGSTGYGRKFWEKSFKQWGRTMQNDITDGVKWLVKDGVADPKRICIYGASYGGYATLAGVTLTPDLYACAVNYVGVSNMFTFMKTIPPYWKPFLDQMYEMVGNPEKDKELLTAVSPVFHVDKIKAPLFVAQGANDPRVNKAESDQIVEALRKRGVTVEYMVKDNEGHGFANEENRFDFYRAMDKFLSQHLGKKPASGGKL